MSADLDGDSQMRSSDESSLDDYDAMFPSEHDPPAAFTHNDLNNGGVASSTPPQSQDPKTDAMDTQEGGDAGASTREMGWGNVGSSSGMSGFAQSALAQESSEPGACWNNRKAREEYERAIRQIEDKGFSLKEFGDPFDEEQEQGSGKR
ncbi:hypothetical protein P7C71_g4482, partial [Lecanoromycetidae sp. Uapishka_2]